MIMISYGIKEQHCFTEQHASRNLLITWGNVFMFHVLFCLITNCTARCLLTVLLSIDS